MNPSILIELTGNSLIWGTNKPLTRRDSVFNNRTTPAGKFRKLYYTSVTAKSAIKYSSYGMLPNGKLSRIKHPRDYCYFAAKMVELEETYSKENTLPIVTAFQGQITVAGTSRSVDSLPTDALYKKTVIVYGATIGELLDNLVEASVAVTNDVFTWAALNKPANYSLMDDFWYCQIAHPPILTSDVNNPKTHDTDTGSGSSLDSPEAIVKFVALVRDIGIKSALLYLVLETREQPSKIVEEPKVPFKGIYNVSSFNEMTKFGFSGAELDENLAIAQEEGRLQTHRENLELLRNHRNRNRSAEPKKSWLEKFFPAK